MKKDYKKLYMYATIMTMCVLLIVLIACLSESRLDSYQEEYEDMLMERQSEIQELEDKLAELENENYELKKQVEENMTVQSKLDTQNQIMNDLTHVYKLIKDGKRQEARDNYAKIETSGFDDAALSYYEMLGSLLKK